MARVYVFGDESGNLDFRNAQGATRYFVVATVVLRDCTIGSELLDLKRRLHWEGCPVRDYFHAVDDKQVVRDRVFGLLTDHEFRVDATILEKPKAMPHFAQNGMRFYKEACYLHLKYLVPRITAADDELHLIAASFGTNARKTAARAALHDVVAQTALRRAWQIALWPAATDPCLQAADYCCWAIQRKWEGNDPRSHALIANKIRSEFDAFAMSSVRYY